jgi:multicomponent Na+:H+ antiporter subunit E
MKADSSAVHPGEAVWRTRSAWTRLVLFFGFWVVLMPSPKLADLAVGALAALGATAVSLHLLPPSLGRLRFRVLVALMPHFMWQSVLAGLDVARRAFAPKLPLNPGFVNCPMAFPPGLARNTFATISSLLPGSVPCGDGDEALVYHCIDINQPVVEDLREEERILGRALVAGSSHG